MVKWEYWHQNFATNSFLEARMHGYYACILYASSWDPGAPQSPLA